MSRGDRRTRRDWPRGQPYTVRYLPCGKALFTKSFVRSEAIVDRIRAWASRHMGFLFLIGVAYVFVAADVARERPILGFWLCLPVIVALIRLD